MEALGHHCHSSFKGSPCYDAIRPTNTQLAQTKLLLNGEGKVSLEYSRDTVDASSTLPPPFLKTIK